MHKNATMHAQVEQNARKMKTSLLNKPAHKEHYCDVQAGSAKCIGVHGRCTGLQLLVVSQNIYIIFHRTSHFPPASLPIGSQRDKSDMFLMSAAPSGIPDSISFNDVNLTSITIQWTELPCSDRNGEITGYTVEYSSTTPLHTNTVTVSGSSTTRLVVVGLLPRTNYTFSVRAQGAAVARIGFRFTVTPRG